MVQALKYRNRKRPKPKQNTVESRSVCKISGKHCNTVEKQVHVYVLQYIIPFKNKYMCVLGTQGYNFKLHLYKIIEQMLFIDPKPVNYTGKVKKEKY